jgi:hypothetical protein
MAHLIAEIVVIFFCNILTARSHPCRFRNLGADVGLQPIPQIFGLGFQEMEEVILDAGCGRWREEAADGGREGERRPPMEEGRERGGRRWR